MLERGKADVRYGSTPVVHCTPYKLCINAAVPSGEAGVRYGSTPVVHQ